MKTFISLGTLSIASIAILRLKKNSGKHTVLESLDLFALIPHVPHTRDCHETEVHTYCLFYVHETEVSEFWQGHAEHSLQD